MIEETHEMKKILVVDDEKGIRDGLAESIESMGFSVERAESGEEALHHLRQSPSISFVITDYKMRGLNGFDVLKEVRKKSAEMPVVVMTGFGNVNHAVNAMQFGATDYLCKPFRFEDLEKIIIKSMPQDEKIELDEIISHDAKFLNLLAKAKRAAKSTAPILIEGPSGTGKELLARQIHKWSDRRSKPWVAINCAALPSGLLESELFGYEKGAFTGAMERKSGRFEQADSGTLLLDEIGELDPLLQAKLLRVLQEGEVDRLGGKRPLKVNVRLIATTNRNLRQLVEEGKFREDLYFRLYGVGFDVPALNERPNDIPVLAETFLKRLSGVQNRSLAFGEGVAEELSGMPWPGNIRELEHSVERAAILSESGVIELQDFEFIPRKKESQSDIRPFGVEASKKSKPIKEMERDIILQALEAHDGNRTHTAKALGMSLRTLRHKLKQYREQGIEVDHLGQNMPSQSCRVPVKDAALSPDSPAAIKW